MKADHVRQLTWVREQLADPGTGELMLTKLLGIRHRGLYARVTTLLEFILTVPDVSSRTAAALIAALEQYAGDKDAIDPVH